MKRIITLAAAVALIIGVAATPSMAAEATLSADVVSAYVWRGLTFNDGLVIQPSIDVAAENGLGVNVWGNFDIDDYDNSLDDEQFSEVDLTISYGTSIGKLDIGGGIIEYLFPATETDDTNELGENFTSTTELYLSLGMDIVAGLSAALDIYYDVDAFNELAYATFGIGYAFDINDKLSLEAGASMGYAGEEFSEANGGDDSGLWDYSVSVSLGFTITDSLSASAFANYVGSLDDDNLVEEDDDGPLDTEFFGGVGIGYSF